MRPIRKKPLLNNLAWLFILLVSLCQFVRAAGSEELFYYNEGERQQLKLASDSLQSEVSILLQSLPAKSEIVVGSQLYQAGGDLLISTDRLIIRFSREFTQAEIDEWKTKYKVEILKKITWLENGFVLRVQSPDADIFAIANRMQVETGVLFCQPSFVRLVRQLSSIPNDLLFDEQWNMHNDGTGDGIADADIDMPEAWTRARGLANVTIAVIDEGVDTTHEDLSSKIVNQYDATDGDNDQQPMSWDGHGTAIAGVIGAIPNNGLGVAGVAWNCSVMPVRIAYKATPLPILWITSDEILADGIATAAIRGADVLNISWGLTTSSEIIYSAIKFAKREGRAGKGCVIVSSTGNSDVNSILFPAAYDETIAVGATNEWDERKSKTTQDGETNWGSNYGPELDVVAPGVHITTTDIMGSGGFNTTGNPLFGDSSGNYWSKFNGTSAATPHVAGLAALIISLDTMLTSDEVQAIIENSADDQVGNITEDIAGWDQYMGHGRINAYTAIEGLSSIEYVSGTLTESQLWDSALVYIVTDELLVPAGLTLTIEPGTVVKFDYVPTSFGVHQRPKLIIEGTLIAQGTDTSPIVFTSINDDQFGGDTKGDGDAILPAAGDWGFIKISSSNSMLEYCLVRYAGVGWFDLSEVEPFDVSYYDKFALWLDGVSSDFSLRSCEFEFCAIAGGDEATNSVVILWEAADLVASSLTISDIIITNAQDGIKIVGQPVGSSVSIENNIFNDLTGTAIQATGLTSASSISYNDIDGGTIGIGCDDCEANLLIGSNSIIDISEIAIALSKSDGTISNNILKQTDGSIGFGVGLSIRDSSQQLIEWNSLFGFDTGIRSEESDLSIQFNSLSGNSSYGIRLGSTDISLADGPTALINFNDLFDNGLYNLYLGDYQNPASNLINVINNWWGSAVHIEIAATIYDNDDNIESPVADYIPYLNYPALTPEPDIEISQAQFDVSLFPDSTITREIYIYNRGINGDLIFSIQEGVAGSSPLASKRYSPKATLADLVWLQVQPDTGIVPPEDSLLIELSFDAANLIDSSYDGFLVIENNDLNESPFVIPMSLEVSSLFLLFPNGGEQFISGENRTISWQMIETQLIDSLKLWLSVDGGETYNDLIARGPFDSNRVAWQIPNQATDSGSVRAEIFYSDNSQSTDESDSFFKIVTGPYFCGQFTSGHTGNTDCDVEGKRNLADLTRLIDRIYVSKVELCNVSEGNVDGDFEMKLNLADITSLIDHVYITKTETALCE